MFVVGVDGCKLSVCLKKYFVCHCFPMFYIVYHCFC